MLYFLQNEIIFYTEVLNIVHYPSLFLKVDYVTYQPHRKKGYN